MEEPGRNIFDVRVTHPTVASHLKKSMEALYRENENEKKRAYNDKVMNIEKGAFTPLVFSTTGGMGPECTRLNKQLAELISQKTSEVYAHVMWHLRTRLKFALLRATLVAEDTEDKKAEVKNLRLKTFLSILYQK